MRLKNIFKPLSAVLAVLAVLPGFALNPALASETENESENHRYQMAVFLGGTEVDGKYEPTLGLELTYHINHRWSAWGLIEQSDRDQDTTLVMAGLGLHPYKDLVLIVGAGRKDPAEERENALRFGAAYDIELSNNWFVEPYAGVDIIENEEHETVLGVYFGKKF